MTVPGLKEGTSATSFLGIILGALVSGIVGGLIATYQAQGSDIRDQGKDISALKVEMSVQQQENSRTESAISSLNISMTNMLSAVKGLTDGNQDTVNALNNIEKRLNDIDGVLRPVIHLPNGGR